MLFSNPVAKPFAEGSFYHEGASDLYVSTDKLRGDYSPVRYAREIKLLRRFCTAGKILDVGCSTGGFLYFLRDRFRNDYELFGTDVAGAALDYAESKEIPVIRRSFLAPEFPENGFDAVTFWAVLEHVRDPAAFLQRAYSLLKRGGLCFVLVPNIKSLAARMLGAKYRYILPQHLNYFSNETLRDLADRTGFSVVHATTTHFNPLVIWQDFKNKSGIVPDADRANLLVRTNNMKSSTRMLPARMVYSAAERVLGLFGKADNSVIVMRKF
jgi:2-polyprenyl-3-methyl-5-hydroxy-6-metoxy-1,4-benzoquinol methylase